MQVHVYNQEGATTGTMELPDAIFGVAVKPAVLWEAARAQMANRRKVLAHAKTRAEVRGGGRKPWKQKGTGRARVGSSRSPIWSGGGVTFGPSKDNNFSIRINAKVRKAALKMALSDRATHERVFVFETLPEDGKTKAVASALKKLPNVRKVLLVIAPKADAVRRATRNIASVRTIGATSMNVVDVLWADQVVMSKDALAVMVATYGKEKKQAPERIVPKIVAEKKEAAKTAKEKA